MATNITFPKIGNVSLRDLGKGFLITIISTALTVLYSSIAENTLPTLAQLKTALLVGVGTSVSYLIKQLMTGIPSAIEVDVTKTKVIDQETKQVLIDETELITDVRTQKN